MLARIVMLSTLVSLAVPAVVTAAEAQQSFHVDYSVSILGLNVGRSSFKSTIDGDSFRLNGSLASSGIAKIFDTTQGTTTVSGRFAAASPLPDSYLLNYTSGKKKKRTEIAFANGSVTRTENVPPLRRGKAKYVEVNEGDLASVVDPISATMVRAGSLQDVCNRTLKVYDGELRADLRLSFAGIAPMEAKGFSGDTVTCNVKFVPVGGYKPKNRSILYMQNKSKISITFAPLGTTGIYAPLKATAGTEIGTLTIVANRFEAVK